MEPLNVSELGKKKQFYVCFSKSLKRKIFLCTEEWRFLYICLSFQKKKPLLSIGFKTERIFFTESVDLTRICKRIHTKTITCKSNYIHSDGHIRNRRKQRSHEFSSKNSGKKKEEEILIIIHGNSVFRGRKASSRGWRNYKFGHRISIYMPVSLYQSWSV